MSTPKWVVLTNSLGDYHTRNYHFFNDDVTATAIYNSALQQGLVPTMRGWHEKHDREVFRVLQTGKYVILDSGII